MQMGVFMIGAANIFRGDAMAKMRKKLIFQPRFVLHAIAPSHGERNGQLCGTTSNIARNAAGKPIKRL